MPGPCEPANGVVRPDVPLVSGARWEAGMRRSRKLAGPFHCFASSREVARLVAVTYVRFPLNLTSIKDLLFERGIDVCHEPRQALVEQVRADVRGRDAALPGQSHTRFPALAVALGRHVRETEKRDGPLVASDGSGRLSALGLRHENPRQECRAPVDEGVEAPRHPRADHPRRAPQPHRPSEVQAPTLRYARGLAAHRELGRCAHRVTWIVQRRVRIRLTGPPRDSLGGWSG